MRKLWITLTIMLFCKLSFAQYYAVLVNEKVYADGKLIKKGQQIDVSAKLKFSSQKAYAHVISPKSGQFVLTGKKVKKNKKGEFFSALKEAIIPQDQFQSATTRSRLSFESTNFEDHYDLKAFFRDKLVFTDTLAFTFSSRRYPLDEGNYFVVRHLINDEVVEKILCSFKDTTLLPPEILHHPNGTDLSGQIVSSELIHVNTTSDKETPFGPFKLRFLSQKEQEELRKELEILYLHLSPKSLDDFINRHASPFLDLYYGSFIHEDLLSIVKDIK